MQLPETEVDFLFIFLSSAFHIEIARSAVPFQAFTTSKKTYSHEKFVGDINNRVACYYAYTQPGHGKKNTYCGSFFCTGEIEFLLLIKYILVLNAKINAKRGLILKTLIFQRTRTRTD